MIGTSKLVSGAVSGGWLVLVLWLGATSAIMLTPQVALAADSAESARASARRLVAEGDGFYARQDYARALDRYAAAYRLVHVPTVGIEVLKAQKALGKLLEANGTAREVAALPKQPSEPAVFDEARQQAAQTALDLSALVPTLGLDVTPRGVDFRVQIDGVAALTPAPFRLNPGTHRIRVSADGYQVVQLDVTLREAEHQTLSALLLKTPSANPALAAASVAPQAAPSESAGPAQEPPGDAAPEPDRADPARTRGWIGLGVAGVTAGVGTVAGVLAFKKKPDCPNDLCAPSQEQDIQASKTLGYIADVSFGVAIVAGAFGIWQLASSGSADDTGSGASAEAPASPAVTVGFGSWPLELHVSGGF